MRLFIIALTFISTLSVNAQTEPLEGTHQILCLSQNEDKRIIIQVSGIFPETYEEVAEVSIQSMINGKFEIDHSITNAQTINLSFINVGTREQFAEEVFISMGRSGEMKIKIEKDRLSTIYSTSRYFYYPNPVENYDCSYSFALGPKPGYSGSN